MGTDGLCVHVNMVETYGCSVGTEGLSVDVDALWERTRMDADTGKNNGKRKNLTIKHTRMPPMCKKPTRERPLCARNTGERQGK